jgi:hypothetical protein
MGHAFAARKTLPQAISYALQEQVAYMMPERVIDETETLHVECSHHCLAAKIRWRADQARDPLTEQRAIGQVRERIEIGEVTKRAVLVQVLERK